MSSLAGGAALGVRGDGGGPPRTPPTDPTPRHPQRHPRQAVGSLQLNGASMCCHPAAYIRAAARGKALPPAFARGRWALATPMGSR